MKHDLSVIFEEEPDQWGLRGDPFLWAELKEESKGKELAYHADFIVSSSSAVLLPGMIFMRK